MARESVIEIGDASIEDLALLHWSIAQELDRRGGNLDSYAAPHVWNLVAKQIREHYPEHEPAKDDKMGRMRVHAERRILEDLALAFAHRFDEDEGFDPPAWLDKCSPDPERYPMSEMWDG